ncbi:P-type DNA transfer ATPase VirB11 [uncultured Jannaschia sp.]|uniref:P-type DNA transfer ATPase VirB11 n=1 Tax=uncultured Jannaschia sp. TaxID=293347 RepID=UPI00260698FD|nr:P-type DNA transfer ATPase VirB11 [uncultured Jannaschia sp.]
MNQPPSPASYAEQGLLPLRDLLVSEEVNEVVINPDRSVWVEYAQRGHMERWDGTIPPDRLNTLGAHLAGEAKTQLGRHHPIVSGRVHVFGQSMRVQVIVPPAIEAGVSVSIRKYVSRILELHEVGFLMGSEVDVEAQRRNRLEELRALTEAGDLANLMHRAVTEKLNILVSGGTSSGKTTLARAIMSMADRNERMVTIEDAPELHLPHPNTVGLVADRRTDSERSPARLLESALRMRPDRLILGEIRGAEAFNFLEAINTGHPGSISTIHADSPQLALERMAMMVLRAGLDLGRDDILDYARATIDLVIQTGRHEGRRGVLQVFMPTLSRSQEVPDKF